uniref:Uncharacterized protein n=1 Tax=Caenorhabditis japonica TaxID=281687 RepID=A0A8R1EIH8_CAEJA
MCRRCTKTAWGIESAPPLSKKAVFASDPSKKARSTPTTEGGESVSDTTKKTRDSHIPLRPDAPCLCQKKNALHPPEWVKGATRPH